MQIGLKIRELRQQAGISQEALARALQMTPQAVSRWETGVTAPDISLLPSIASYFDVSIDALFAYDATETAQALERFFDEYNAAPSESEARAMLQAALRRWPGQEALRLLQCFHMRAPEDRSARLSLCRELTRSKDPTVRTEAWIILAHTCHEDGDEGRARDYLAQLPECDTTKLSLSAQLFSGEEAMLCAQRQKSSSLAMLLTMLLRIAALYREADAPAAARQTLRCARSILEALGEDAPYRFPKGDRPASTRARFAAEFEAPIARQLRELEGETAP